MFISWTVPGKRVVQHKNFKKMTKLLCELWIQLLNILFCAAINNSIIFLACSSWLAGSWLFSLRILQWHPKNISLFKRLLNLPFSLFKFVFYLSLLFTFDLKIKIYALPFNFFNVLNLASTAACCSKFLLWRAPVVYLSLCLRVLCRADFDVVWFLQTACNDSVLTVRLQQLVKEKDDHEIFLLGVLGSFVFQGKMEWISS